MTQRERFGVNRAPFNKMKLLLLLFCSFLLNFSGCEAAHYAGQQIGALSEVEHGVKGVVYAVDSRTIHIKGFSYDGQAPDAFFYTATSGEAPHDKGIIIPDENGGTLPLGPYRNKDVTLTLPDGLTLKDVPWISVWCREYSVNFGHVKVPRTLDYPRPQKVDALPTFNHGVASDKIVVVDAQTFLIPNFYYDGLAPDAFFWVGKGTPDTEGIRVPDENGSLEPLKKYSGKTIVITLPGDLTVFDIDYLGVWCRAFYVDFGHVVIPQNLNVPPSLKMLGVAPQTKLNCEVLYDDLAFEVRWAVAGDSIVMQLVGKVDNGEYMAFGLSGSDTRSVMVGGDVTVAWLDQNSGSGEAVDYILNAKSQCQGGTGSCPDSKVSGGKNNVRLLNAAYINDFTMLTFQRPLKAGDGTDKSFNANKPQQVIWAIGPVNSQGDTSYHRLRNSVDMKIDFGRPPKWNCPLPDAQETRSNTPARKPSSGNLPASVAASKDAWHIPSIPCYEPEDGVFYAQIGPTGGDKGYNAITGHVGWGISWYINGLLIPEINVVRGKTYTFVVEGGADPKIAAKYHPFYISDDPEGGYEYKTKAERANVQVFAGVEHNRDGSVSPTATGRLCEWKEDVNQPASDFNSFGAYQRSLTLDCQEGQPGILQWTPDQSTPDTVYYQCFTHRFLGWKINVVDSCDSVSSGSQPQPEVSSPTRGSRADYDDYYSYDDYEDQTTPLSDVTVGGSTRFETRVVRPYSKYDKESQLTFFDNEEYFDDISKTSFGFDSFPFDFDPRRRPDKSQNFLQNTQPKPPKKTIPILPDRKRKPDISENVPFKFPRLPDLKIQSEKANASGFTEIRRFSKIFPKLFKKTPEFQEKEVQIKFSKESRTPEQSPSSIRKGFGVQGDLSAMRKGLTSREIQNIVRTNPRFKSRKVYHDTSIEDIINSKELREKNKNFSTNSTTPGAILTDPRYKSRKVYYDTSIEDIINSKELRANRKSFSVTSNTPRTIVTRGPVLTKRLAYQTIQRTSATTPKSARTSETDVKFGLRKPYEVRENPTKRPVVIAKPYKNEKSSRNQNSLRNYNSAKPKSSVKGVPKSSVNKKNSLNNNKKTKELVKNHFDDFSRKNKFNKAIMEIDPSTGLPYAKNEGFDPSTIIFERDFKPVDDANSIDHNLVFKVSSTKSFVGSNPPEPFLFKNEFFQNTYPIPTEAQHLNLLPKDTLVPPKPIQQQYFNHKDPRIREAIHHSEQKLPSFYYNNEPTKLLYSEENYSPHKRSENFIRYNQHEVPEKYPKLRPFKSDDIESAAPTDFKHSIENLRNKLSDQDDANHQEGKLVYVNKNINNPYIIPYNNLKEEALLNPERRDESFSGVSRPVLPAFKLRPPPPPPDSPYKRFARKIGMVVLKRNDRDPRTNIEQITSDTLSYLNLFPKLPPTVINKMKRGQLITAYRVRGVNNNNNNNYNNKYSFEETQLSPVIVNPNLKNNIHGQTSLQNGNLSNENVESSTASSFLAEEKEYNYKLQGKESHESVQNVSENVGSSNDKIHENDNNTEENPLDKSEESYTHNKTFSSLNGDNQAIQFDNIPREIPKNYFNIEDYSKEVITSTENIMNKLRGEQKDSEFVVQTKKQETKYIPNSEHSSKEIIYSTIRKSPQMNVQIDMDRVLGRTENFQATNEPVSPKSSVSIMEAKEKYHQHSYGDNNPKAKHSQYSDRNEATFRPSPPDIEKPKYKLPAEPKGGFGKNQPFLNDESTAENSSNIIKNDSEKDFLGNVTKENGEDTDGFTVQISNDYGPKNALIVDNDYINISHLKTVSTNAHQSPVREDDNDYPQRSATAIQEEFETEQILQPLIHLENDQNKLLTSNVSLSNEDKATLPIIKDNPKQQTETNPENTNYQSLEEKIVKPSNKTISYSTLEEHPQPEKPDSSYHTTQNDDSDIHNIEKEPYENRLIPVLETIKQDIIKYSKVSEKSELAEQDFTNETLSTLKDSKGIKQENVLNEDRDSLDQPNTLEKQTKYTDQFNPSNYSAKVTISLTDGQYDDSRPSVYLDRANIADAEPLPSNLVNTYKTKNELGSEEPHPNVSIYNEQTKSETQAYKENFDGKLKTKPEYEVLNRRPEVKQNIEFTVPKINSKEKETVDLNAGQTDVHKIIDTLINIKVKEESPNISDESSLTHEETTGLKTSSVFHNDDAHNLNSNTGSKNEEYGAFDHERYEERPNEHFNLVHTENPFTQIHGINEQFNPSHDRRIIKAEEALEENNPTVKNTASQWSQINRDEENDQLTEEAISSVENREIIPKQEAYNDNSDYQINSVRKEPLVENRNPSSVKENKRNDIRQAVSLTRLREKIDSAPFLTHSFEFLVTPNNHSPLTESLTEPEVVFNDSQLPHISQASTNDPDQSQFKNVEEFQSTTDSQKSPFKNVEESQSTTDSQKSPFKNVEEFQSTTDSQKSPFKNVEESQSATDSQKSPFKNVEEFHSTTNSEKSPSKNVEEFQSTTDSQKLDSTSTLTKNQDTPQQQNTLEKEKLDLPKFDYKKSAEQLTKSSPKSTHLTILKDIWDNLTGGSTRQRS